MTTLKEGKKAPAFKGKDQNGKLVSLADYKGKKVVLYFYPQDNTPTCTKEACNLRDNYEMLLSKGYVVLGVSPDNETSHLKFIKKHNLPFPLLADTERAIVDSYGVWAEKTTFGKTYLGIIRTTFVIDEKGVIQEVISKVDSANHAEQILKTT